MKVYGIIYRDEELGMWRLYGGVNPELFTDRREAQDRCVDLHDEQGLTTYDIYDIHEIEVQ